MGITTSGNEFFSELIFLFFKTEVVFLKLNVHSLCVCDLLFRIYKNFGGRTLKISKTEKRK